MRDLDNKIYGIILIGTSNRNCECPKIIEASEKRFSNILAQSIMFQFLKEGHDYALQTNRC
jgi:hypothetical protein